MSDPDRARRREDLLLRRPQLVGRGSRAPLADSLRRAFRVDDPSALRDSVPVKTWWGAPVSFGGYEIVESPHLPLIPTDAENGRRIARHGLADWVRYIGEEVGPKPNEVVHALVYGPTLIASPEALSNIRRIYAGEKVTLTHDD